eukprot:jgi/Tetstr1/454154/TSEL_041073.t1
MKLIERSKWSRPYTPTTTTTTTTTTGEDPPNPLGFVCPMATGYTAKARQVLLSWICEVLANRSQWDANLKEYVYLDLALIAPIASIVDRYYETNEWSIKYCQLVGISAYRLVAMYAASVSCPHSEVEHMCDGAYTVKEIREYLPRVWMACGADDSRRCDVHHHMKIYTEFHVRFCGFDGANHAKPTFHAGAEAAYDRLVTAVVKVSRPSLEDYMHEDVTVKDLYEFAQERVAKCMDRMRRPASPPRVALTA